MHSFRFLALIACSLLAVSPAIAQPPPPPAPSTPPPFELPMPSRAPRSKKVVATFDSFVAAIAQRDAHALHRQLHEDLQKSVEEPILQFLLDETEKLGRMSDDDYDQSIERKKVDGVQVETTTASLPCPRGPLNVKVSIRQSQVISFDLKADNLNQLDERLAVELLGNQKFVKSLGDYLAPRGEKMLRLVLEGEDETAYALLHPEIQQQAPLEKVKPIFAAAREAHGGIEAIEFEGMSVRVGEDEKLKNFTLNYLLDCKKNQAKGTITFQVVGLSAALVGINYVPISGDESAPENSPEKSPAKRETQLYQHDKAKLSATHAEKFVPFRFKYPVGWELDSVAGTERSPNSLKVKRNLDLDSETSFTQENFAVGSCQVSGVGELAKLQLQLLSEQLRGQFEKGFPEFKLNREAEMKFGKYDGYGFDFSCRLPHTKKGEVDCWGRVVLLPPSAIGQVHGLAIVMLATSEAPELKSLDDLGVKGDLPVIIESFEVGDAVPAPPRLDDSVPPPPAP